MAMTDPAMAEVRTRLARLVSAAPSWAMLIVAKRGIDGGVHMRLVRGYSTREEAEAAASCINEADGGSGYLKAIAFPAPARR